MATSRGVRLSLLAARGLLNCPSCYAYLYLIFKESGIDIELAKEILFANMQNFAAAKNFEAYESAKKQLNKLLFPDVETQEEKLMRTAKEQLGRGKEIVKIGKKGSKIDLGNLTRIHT